MFIVYGILILSVIVFIHELGHFIAAKLCGIEVEAFSIGMGPVLLHKKIGKTDWRLSLVLFGGYCAMKGEKDFVDYENDGQFIETDKTSFYGVHPLKRALTAFFGPFFNFLFAIICFSIVSMVGYDYLSASNKIQIVNEIEEYKDYPSVAKEAGILTGDIILSVNDNETPDFMALYEQIGQHPDEDITIKVLRDDKQIDFTLHTQMDYETGLGKIGITNFPDSIKMIRSKTYSFFPAFGQGFLQTINTLSLTVKGIKILFSGINVSNAVSGPARITQMLGSTVENSLKGDLRNGLSRILNFMAIINISLFFMNLLPIPVLDGGLILFALIEAIFKRRISPKVQNRIQYIGIAIIVLLFSFAIYSDLKYFLQQ